MEGEFSEGDLFLSNVKAFLRCFKNIRIKKER